MLVCPNCRSENIEDATVCRHCGNGLEAVSSPMRRIDRPEEEEEAQLDLMPARATSPWPLIIGALVLGLGLLGWGLAAALRPNPCEGKYSSALFSYCVERPDGWVGGSSFNPGGNVDRYLRLGLATSEEDAAPGMDGEPGTPVETPAPVEPSVPPELAASGEPLIEAVTTVEVEQLLDPSVSTPQYAQQFRTSQQAGGLNPSPIESVTIDGEQAVGWDVPEVQTADGVLHHRVILVVRPDGAWQIRFFATPEAYGSARRSLEEMLASWRWKA